MGKGWLRVVANNLKSLEVSISEWERVGSGVANNLKSLEVRIPKWERKGAQGCSQKSQVLGVKYSGVSKGGLRVVANNLKSLEMSIPVREREGAQGL